MPFDGTKQDTKVVEVLDMLLAYYRSVKEQITGALSIDLPTTIRSVRKLGFIRGDDTRKYLLKALGVPNYYNLTLDDLNWIITGYNELENTLLRARDLASGEPMRALTWQPRPHGCECTTEKACRLTEYCMPFRRAR